MFIYLFCYKHGCRGERVRHSPKESLSNTFQYIWELKFWSYSCVFFIIWSFFHVKHTVRRMLFYIEQQSAEFVISILTYIATIQNDACCCCIRILHIDRYVRKWFFFIMLRRRVSITILYYMKPDTIRNCAKIGTQKTTYNNNNTLLTTIILLSYDVV